MDRAAAADRHSGMRNKTERGISDRSPSLCFLSYQGSRKMESESLF